MPIVRHPPFSTPTLLPRQSDGSPPPWQLRRQSYLRSLRSFFVGDLRGGLEDRRRSELRARMRQAIERDGPLSHAELRARVSHEIGLTIEKPLVVPALGEEPSRSLGNRVWIRASPWPQEARFEVDVPDDARVFDVAPYFAEEEDDTTVLRVVPPWWPELVDWVAARDAEAGRTFAARAAFGTELDDVWPLVAAFAFDAGHEVVLLRYLHRDFALLRPEARTRVVAVRAMGGSPPTHVDILRLALDSSAVRDMPLDLILAGCGSGGRAPAYFGIPENARPSIADLARLVETIVRLNHELRLRDRTEAQDDELNRLTVAAVRRAMAALARVSLVNARGYGGMICLLYSELLPMPAPGSLRDRDGVLLQEALRGISSAMVEITRDFERGHRMADAVVGMRDHLGDVLRGLGWGAGVDQAEATMSLQEHIF